MSATERFEMTHYDENGNIVRQISSQYAGDTVTRFFDERVESQHVPQDREEPPAEQTLFESADLPDEDPAVPKETA